MRTFFVFFLFFLPSKTTNALPPHLSQTRSFDELLYSFSNKFSNVINEVNALEAKAIAGVNEVAGKLLQITDDLLFNGLRLERLEKLFAGRNYTHYRQTHQNIGLLKQLIPQITFDSILGVCDPILQNIEAGLSKYLFEGDIVLTDDQMNGLVLSFDEEDDRNEMGDGTWRKKRQITKMFDRWENGILYYFMDDSVDERTKKSVAYAIRYIENFTCIKFIYDETAQDTVRVFSGNGCYSSVGRVGGQQNLSLGIGCSVVGTVTHEFSHALGIWHTQMRDDRDEYVTIDLDAIQESYEPNFAKLATHEVYSVTPYEYGSSMHYPSNAFSRDNNSTTIIPNVPDYVHTMGNRMISFYDMEMLNHHYKCRKLCSPKHSAKCGNGGYPNPNDCDRCVCPLGYGGQLCDQLPDDGGRILTASPDWQSYKIELGMNTTEQRDEFTTSTHWIIAPEGFEIQVKITGMYNSQCQISCPYNGIEIKRLPDVRITNPRFCCTKYKNIVYTSENNPTPIITFNRFSISRFSIMYRYAKKHEVKTGKSAHSKSTTRKTPATRGDRSIIFA